MQTPDLTLVQKLAGAIIILMGAIWPLLEAFGWGLTDAQTIAITGAVTAFLAVAVAADAVIRFGRSKIAVAQVEKAPAARPRASSK